MIYRKEDIKADLQKVLMKYAKQDINHAKKKGGLIITDTKHGNVDVKSNGKEFTISTVGMSGKELFKGNEKEAMEFLANAYRTENKKVKEAKFNLSKVKKLKVLKTNLPNVKKGDIYNVFKRLGGYVIQRKDKDNSMGYPTVNQYGDDIVILSDLGDKKLYKTYVSIVENKKISEASFEDKVKAIMKTGKSRESAEKIAGAMVRDMKAQGKESTQIKEAIKILGLRDKEVSVEFSQNKDMIYIYNRLNNDDEVIYRGKDGKFKTNYSKKSFNKFSEALVFVLNDIGLSDASKKKVMKFFSKEKMPKSEFESKKINHKNHIKEMKSISEKFSYPKKKK